MDLDDLRMELDDFRMEIDEFRMELDDVGMVLDDLRMVLDDFRMELDDIRKLSKMATKHTHRVAGTAFVPKNVNSVLQLDTQCCFRNMLAPTINKAATNNQQQEQLFFPGSWESAPPLPGNPA
ncbi:hypothetical protein ABVT39_021158 [Epinephelus coioides]